MCEPTTLAMIAIGTQVAGMAVSARGAKQASQARRGEGEYQAAVERNKATVAEWQGKDAIARGQQEQVKAQLKTAQLKGAQRARFAAAGLDLEEGSAFNVLMDTDYLGKTDVMTIQDNAEKEAWSYRESARTGMSNSDFLRRRAAAEDPNQAAVTSLLGSSGQVASSWYSMSASGTGRG